MLQRRGSIRIVAELPGGYTGARVFVAEEQVTPDDPQPFSLVFKVAKGVVLREEVERYQSLRRHARAHKAFAEIIEPRLTLMALVDEYECAIAYEHVAAAFGRNESVSLKDVVATALGDEIRVSGARDLLLTTMSAVTSMYGHPETTFAFDIARYYLDRWLPHFSINIEEAVEVSSHWLLTRHRLNPAYFNSESPTKPEMVRRAGESTTCDLPENLVLPMLTVRRPIRGAFIVEESDLSLELDLTALSADARRTVADLENVAVWAPPERDGRRYAQYHERLQRAFLGEDLSRAIVAIGGHWFHNPLHHLSQPLIDKTRPSVKTWAVPGHGDLHPGNVLAVGTSPVIIDYGLSETRLPIGVDAARLFGGLIRDVFSEALSVDELTRVLRAVVLNDADALSDAPPQLGHAATLLGCIQSAALEVMGDSASELWALHLYGFAFIGLKWAAETPHAHAACGLLAAVALTSVMGAPSPDDVLMARRAAPDTGDGYLSGIAPEAPAEILVLVAKFHGSAEYDPTARVYQALADNLFEVIPEITRVEYVDRIVLSRKDAIALAGHYQASMVVWGSYDNLGIRPRYEITRDSLLARQSMIQLDEATRHSLQEKFDIYITTDLADEISFLSLKAVGDMCMLNLNHSAALRVYDKALSLVSHSERLRALGAAEIHRAVAGILFGLRRHEDAIEANARASELAPDDLLTHLQALSLRSAVEKRSTLETINDLCALIREKTDTVISGDEREALGTVLMALESIKSPKDLKNLIDKARRMPQHYESGPNLQFAKDVTAHLRKAHEHVEHAEFQKAFKELRLALRLNPICAAAVAGRANLLAIIDRVPEALVELEHAEKIDPNEVRIYLCRAEIYSFAGEYEKCLENIEQMRQLGFGPTGHLLAWGLSLIGLGRGEEMMAALKVEDVAPDTPAIFQLKATYFRIAGQYGAALREVEEGLQIDPDNILILEERARIYAAQNLLELALADAHRAASLSKHGTFKRRTCEELIRELNAKIETTARVAAQPSDKPPPELAQDALV